MKLYVDQSNVPAGERFKEALFKRIEKEANNSIPNLPEGSIDLKFVDDQEIRRLNRMYRNKDSVTDVLSFSYLEDHHPNENIGDIVISYPQAVRQSQEGDIELEVVDLTVHGILHTLGYDHETPHDAQEMFPLQDKLVQQIL